MLQAKWLAAAVIAAVSLSPSTWSQPIIQTIAGGGPPDGTPGVKFPLGTVQGLATDAAGNTYISITNAGFVYRMDPSGAMHFFAGSMSGTSRLSGPANDTFLYGPRGLACDGTYLYIADRLQHRIVRVDLATGMLTTYAGGGSNAADGILATKALLNLPTALTLDGEKNLYVTTGSKVRKISALTGIITTFAGTGTDGHSGDGGPAKNANINPYSLASDGADGLFIGEYNFVRRVSLSTGIISTIAGTGLLSNSGDGGPAVAATVYGPAGIFLGIRAGHLYLSAAAQVRRIQLSSGVIERFAGVGTEGSDGDGGPALAAQLSLPGPIAFPNGSDVYIADVNVHLIRIVNAGGTIFTFAGVRGTSEISSALQLVLRLPRHAVVDATRTYMYIADEGGQRVYRVTLSTGEAVPFAGTGTRSESGDGGPATDAGLMNPRRLLLDGQYLYVSTSFTIRRINLATGIIERYAGVPMGSYDGHAAETPLQPTGMAVDASGNIYVVSHSVIYRIDVTTGLLTRIAGNPQQAGFSGDNGPATDASIAAGLGTIALDRNNLYLADGFNHRIRQISLATGLITTIAGGGTEGDGSLATEALLSAPHGLAIDAQGNLYFTEDDGARIRRISATNQRVSTVAGTGVPGYSGDGGHPLAGQLRGASGLSFDAAGTLYVADTFNARIRTVSGIAGAPITILQTQPRGLDVIVDGVRTKTPATFAWAPGSAHVVSAVSPQAGPTGEVRFISWSQGGAATQTLIAPTTDAIYGATYSEQTGCSSQISSTVLRLGYLFQQAKIYVTAPAGCAWTALSDTSAWRISAGSSGLGSGVVVLETTGDIAPAVSTVSVAGFRVMIFGGTLDMPQSFGVFRNGRWKLDLRGDGTAPFFMDFGQKGDIPFMGSWVSPRKGLQQIAVFRAGTWFLHLSDSSSWDPVNDKAGRFGIDGDVPLIGDWLGDGRTRIGVFRKGWWYLDLNGNFEWDFGDRAAYFGQEGDIPVVGDWTGDGRTKIGVFRRGQWFLDADGRGEWNPESDYPFSFGQQGDVPVVGAWDAGSFKVGVFRNGQWFLDVNGNRAWDGPSVDVAGSFGAPGDVPLVGYWDMSGYARIGVFRAGTFYLDKNGNANWDGTPIDRGVTFGEAGDIPITQIFKGY